MSLSESFNDLAGRTPPPDPSPPALATDAAPNIQPPDPTLIRLRNALDGILTVAGEQRGQQRRVGQVYIFRGRLLLPAQSAYATISERFKALGYTPLLQRDDDEEVVIALEGTVPTRQIGSPWWLHLGLLLLTLITTTVMGAALSGNSVSAILIAVREWNMSVLQPALRDGLPFSLTLLTILGVHEMGHYVAARLHGVKVTLPFFIPLPLANSLGTMGAVIFIKSPLINRRALFDVGIAGPLAGLAVAVPFYLVGLQADATLGMPSAWLRAGIWRVSNPPLLEWLAALTRDTANLDRIVLFGHPMALAAWFGVLLTSLNLLPIGQFDGGHVAYALFGRRAWTLATVTFFVLIMLGFTGAWFTWLIWAFMGLLTGLRHPPPYDDLTPLGWTRALIGAATIVLFFLILVPVPFYGQPY